MPNWASCYYLSTQCVYIYTVKTIETKYVNFILVKLVSDSVQFNVCTLFRVILSFTELIKILTGNKI